MIKEVAIMCRASFRNINVVSCVGWSVGEDTDSSSMGKEESLMARMALNMDHEEKVKLVDKQFNLFMEYVAKGSIADRLKKHGPLNEIMVRNFTRQLLMGVRSLHAAGIAHRDIKCQNLLLSNDNTLKVADFGSAKKFAGLGSDGEYSSIQGSVPWMAPEVIRQEISDGGSDIKGWKYADIWAIYSGNGDG